MNAPRVQDYMTRRLITLTPQMGIQRAIQLLLEHRVSGAPVVNDAQQLIGVLSKKDCLKAVLNASYFQELAGSVSDYMSTDVETLAPDLELVEAAKHFLGSHYRRFPVVQDGQLVGQISRADVLRALLQNWR